MPYSKRPGKAHSVIGGFMAVEFNREKCLSCGGCVSVCPKDALTLKNMKMEVDPEKCIECGMCVDFCPVGAPFIKKKE